MVEIGRLWIIFRAVKTITIFLALVASAFAGDRCLTQGEAWASAMADAIASGGTVVRIAPTGSMKPCIDEKSLVVIVNRGVDSIKRGEIVVYRNSVGNMVIHRAVNKPLFGGKSWIVKGDANVLCDREYVSSRNYVGVVVRTFSFED